LKCVRGKQAAGDQLLGEFDLAGGKSGGGGFGQGAVEQFVIEKLMGDLGEAFGGKDRNWEGDTIQGVIVRFRDRGGEALTEFHEAGEA
jgi:hypothetical protein